MRRFGQVGAGAIIAALLTGCVPHPVGPARTFKKYEGKASTTAAGALSAVETARLVAGAATKHGLMGAYVGLTLGESEDAVSSLAGTFGSIQPPDDRADALRTELTQLLSQAEDHLGVLRIAARRGDIRSLADRAQPLADDADALRSFTEKH